MTAADFFQDIAKRYGVGVGAIQDAWDKTDSDDISHEQHVKRFKVYMTKFTGSASDNYSIPEVPSSVSEEIARVMLFKDFNDLQEEIVSILENEEIE